MATPENPGSNKRFTVRITGVQPGANPQELAAAVKQILRGKTTGEITQLLSRLPQVLATSLTEDQARKIHAFLKPKGAILKATYTASGPAPAAAPAPKPAPAPAPKAKPEPLRMEKDIEAQPQEVVSKAATAPGIERRAKPRVHAGIQVHPMGVGEILDRAFRLLRQYFFLFFLIVFIPQGVYFLLSHGVSLIFGMPAAPKGVTGMGIGFGVFSVLTFLVFIVVQFWAQGALIHAVSETYLGHSTSVGASYTAIRGILGRLLGTLILSGVIAFIWIGLAAIVSAVFVPVLGGLVGGVLAAVAMIVGVLITVNFVLNWLLVDKVVVLEDKGGMNALRRSKELMNARTEAGFWRKPKNKAGLILVLGFLIAIGIHLVFQLPGMVFTFIAPGSLVVSALIGLLSIISTSLATVFTATAMILFYYDIRLRKEGFDLKMMAQNL